MVLGFLHLGAPTHGVTRYGRLMAEGARRHLHGSRVTEAQVPQLAGDVRTAQRQVRAAARQMARADVVHLQVNPDVWGGPTRAEALLTAFLDACAAPVVATLHDVRNGYGPADLLRRLAAERQPASAEGGVGDGGASGSARAAWRTARTLAASGAKAARFLRHERAAARLFRCVGRRARRLLVCTAEEARRLEALLPPEGARHVAVVPHVVEPHDLPDAAHAKAALDLDGRRVVTLLGYVHRRKGHALVVDALPLLPLDVTVVFAGRALKPSFAARLRRRAEAMGVADRLRMTGYLAEADLDRVLAATDLAACPFERVAASGSLATWIATGRPILASDLPLVRELNARAGEAVATFAPQAPEAFAAACRRLLVRRAEADARRAALARLRRLLRPSTIARLHAGFYADAVRGA